MIQSPYPNLPGQSPEDGGIRVDRGNGSDAGSNPYFEGYRGAEVPDLDARAPVLKSSEAQRLNRKALTFLAGIVGLLVLMAVMLFRSATSSGDVPARPREETVVIPELPRTSAPSAGPLAEPIALAPTDPAPVVRLPPLPPPDTSGPTPQRSDLAMAALPRQPTLAERRMHAGDVAPPAAGLASPDAYAQAMLAGMQASPDRAAGDSSPVASSDKEASAARFLSNPDALLVRGTYVRCVLETRIVTDIPGFTSCVVTEPVYAINGRRLLLPKGSRLSGKYNHSDPSGPRIAVIWDRVTTPNGMDVSMASPGIDNLGAAGHPGDYDAHWMSRMSAALMVSLVSDAFKFAGARHGPETSTISNGVVVQAPFESNTARTVERLANHALDRSIDRPATVVINQGTIVTVYVAKDVDFSGVLARDQ